MSKATRWVMGAWLFLGCGTTPSTQLRIDPGPARRSEATEPDSLLLPGFELDSSLVTRGAYEACVLSGVCETVFTSGGPHQGPEHPMTDITWEQANRYCAWQGKRLPTSREMERVREVHPQALQLDRDEWVDGWYTYYGWDFLPRVVSNGLIANTRLVHGARYYGGPSRGHPRIGFRCSRWLLSPTG
ncbi:formylglycine-generating enzyme family protein [Cystobacter fuscus]|uniref:SUMF1/EgtB/PvdO family nonheme iron enzyme n=1 Tax=Cystobacter fuscus TaxID=43 RepID=UPI002B2D9780|nr:formylglycine-generating enzyme family protein [Cystobacter fuscus]